MDGCIKLFVKIGENIRQKCRYSSRRYSRREDCEKEEKKIRVKSIQLYPARNFHLPDWNDFYFSHGENHFSQTRIILSIKIKEGMDYDQIFSLFILCLC